MSKVDLRTGRMTALSVPGLPPIISNLVVLPTPSNDSSSSNSAENGDQKVTVAVIAGGPQNPPAVATCDILKERRLVSADIRPC